MRGRRIPKCLALMCSLGMLCAVGGCSFGPKALENTHRKYNEAIKEVAEEELLLNIVRMRYNDNAARLDVTSIASQYEMDATAEARPFFIAPNPSNSNVIFKTFTAILPDASVTGSQRPTISLTPADDPETTRSLFTTSSTDSIIFLAETSYPISTIFRLWVEYLNKVPNAVTASGPPRNLLPEYHDFLRAIEILQMLQDRGHLRFFREEQETEVGSPLPAAAITAAALVDAARNGYEYRQRPDQTWVLTKRQTRLMVRVLPEAAGSPETQELSHLLHLVPGLPAYEIKVGSGGDPQFAAANPQELTSSIHLIPRSPVQAFYYMAHGVIVPPEHFASGVATVPVEADGTVFDWQQVMQGLFTVHSCRQVLRPKNAYVAVKYRDHWYYIDDRDTDSKIAFALMTTMTRVNLLGVRKTGGPALTLPVGH
jgi:hypothetical protein